MLSGKYHWRRRTPQLYFCTVPVSSAIATARQAYLVITGNKNKRSGGVPFCDSGGGGERRTPESLGIEMYETAVYPQI